MLAFVIHAELVYCFAHVDKFVTADFVIMSGRTSQIVAIAWRICHDRTEIRKIITKKGFA